MRRMALLILLLTTLIAGCDGGTPATPFAVEQLVTYPIRTPDPNTKSQYQSVLDAFNNDKVAGLIGSTISDWHGWVINKAFSEKDDYSGRAPFWVELTTSNPYEEELLPTIPWGSSTTSSPSIATAERKLERRREERLLVTTPHE